VEFCPGQVTGPKGGKDRVGGAFLGAKKKKNREPILQHGKFWRARKGENKEEKEGMETRSKDDSLRLINRPKTNLRKIGKKSNWITYAGQKKMKEGAKYTPGFIRLRLNSGGHTYPQAQGVPGAWGELIQHTDL